MTRNMSPEPIKTPEVGVLRQALRRHPFFKDFEDVKLDLYTVSPLLRFSWNQMFLNRAAQELTEELSTTFRDVDANFVTVDAHLPCVVVDVSIGPTCYFRAYMLRVSHSEEERTISLPFFCIVHMKSVKLFKAVKSFLESNYCCNIQKLVIPRREFSWLVGVAVNEALKRGLNEDLTLTYHMEFGDNDRAAMQFVVDDMSVKQLWTGCVGSDDPPEIDFETVNIFMNGLLKHFKKTTSIDCHSVPLREMKFGGVSLSRAHTFSMKVMDRGIAFMILTFLDLYCVKR